MDNILNNPTALLLIFILGAATIHAIYSWASVRVNDVHDKLKSHWTPLEAITVTITVYFWSQVIAAVPLVIILGERAVNQESVLIKFITSLAVDATVLGLLYVFIRRRKGKPSDIGLKQPVIRDVGYVLAGYMVYLVVYICTAQLASGLLGINLDQKQELGFDTGRVEGSLLLVFASLVILPPITEEIIMRGFLYTGLRSRLTMLRAGLITSLLFAVAHLQAGSGNALLWIAAVDTFVLSMVLVYLREKTGSLAAPIGLHMLKNGIAFAALFIFKIA